MTRVKATNQWGAHDFDRMISVKVNHRTFADENNNVSRSRLSWFIWTNDFDIWFWYLIHVAGTPPWWRYVTAWKVWVLTRSRWSPRTSWSALPLWLTLRPLSGTTRRLCPRTTWRGSIGGWTIMALGQSYNAVYITIITPVFRLWELFFSPRTERTKIESATFFNVSVLVTNPGWFKGKVSVEDWLPQSLFSHFQIFISQKLKTDVQPKPCNPVMNNSWTEL